MAYAADIIGDSFKKTKALFFPIRAEYWLRMGFISMFSGTSGRGSGSGGNYGSSHDNSATGMSFREVLASFNQKALSFLSQYGFIVAGIVFILAMIGLFFNYINSVFTFMFIDGLLEKDIRIRKSFRKNHGKGVSLFFLRFIIGFFSTIIVLLIMSPLILSFFRNGLSSFNFWRLIPIVLGVIIFSILMSIFWFFVFDFVVPIMYLKNKRFFSAFNHFKKIARNQKLEILLYWLLKVALSIAAGILTLILLIPMLAILLLFVLIGVVIFLLFRMLSLYPAIAITVLYGIIALMIFSFMFSVVSVPIPAFFRIYSIDMLKKLEQNKKR